MTYNNLKLFIELDQPCIAQLSVTFCYVGPANRAVKPVSAEFLDISSTRWTCGFAVTSTLGRLSILTSLRNNCPILLPINCN